MEFKSLPQLEGFMAEDLQSPRRLNFTAQTVNGVRYNVALLKRYAIFPVLSGQVSVDPLVIGCQVPAKKRSRRSRSPFDFDGFDSFFGSYEEKTVRSMPLAIEILPLPQSGVPEGFTGTVGEYAIDVKSDTRSIEAGQPVQLLVTVSGEGNPETISEPTLILPEGFDKYDSKASTESIVRSGKITGKKSFEYILIPRTAGELTIEPVRFAYFDPAREAYATVRTRPVNLRVTPARKTQADSIPGFIFTKENIHLIGKDIRFIKPDMEALRGQRGLLFRSWGYWTAHLVPPLVLLVLTSYRRHRRKLGEDTGYARLRRASRMAKSRLSTAKGLLAKGERPPFYAEIARALTEYVADKVNASAPGMTREELTAHLVSLGVKEEVKANFLDALEACDFARFAPSRQGADEMASMLERARKLLVSVERG